MTADNEFTGQIMLICKCTGAELQFCTQTCCIYVTEPDKNISNVSGLA